MQNLLLDLLYGFNWVVLWYFILLNIFYMVLLAIAAHAVKTYNNEVAIENGTSLTREFMKPFSVLVPAHNEELTIVQSVRSLLLLDYPEYEVIVCNDGSTDGTMERLKEAFQLEEMDVDFDPRYPCIRPRGIYFSRTDHRLAVIDKPNGGKPDAHNAAASLARYPYVCAVDADSLLHDDSMAKLMQRFVSAPDNVVVGGIVRVSNGNKIVGGHVGVPVMPRKTVERIQVVEYLRAFLFGRLGWSRMNILMIVSGAFSVIRQDLLEKLNGWKRDAIGEDIDIVIRTHRYAHDSGKHVRLSFAPDPVCWTQVPDTLHDLSIQRDRWHRALMQALFENFRMMLNPKYHRLGMIGFPYFFIFEMLGPVIEFIGYPVTIACYLLNLTTFPMVLLFISVAIVWGMALSIASLALSEYTYHRYPRHSDYRQLLWAAFLENFGFRQLHAWWRVKGFIKYIFGKRADWGKIARREMESDAKQAAGQ